MSTVPIRRLHPTTLLDQTQLLAKQSATVPNPSHGIDAPPATAKMLLPSPPALYSASLAAGGKTYRVSVSLPENKGMTQTLWIAYVKEEIEPLLKALQAQKAVSESFDLDFSKKNCLIVINHPKDPQEQDTEKLFKKEQFAPDVQPHFDDFRSFFSNRQIAISQAVRQHFQRSQPQVTYSPIPFIANGGNRCHTTSLWHMLVNNPTWRRQFESTEGHNEAVRAFYRAYRRMQQTEASFRDPLAPKEDSDRLFASWFDEVYKRRLHVAANRQQDIAEVLSLFYQELAPALCVLDRTRSNLVPPILDLGIPAPNSLQDLIDRAIPPFATAPDALFVHLQRNRNGRGTDRTPVPIRETLSFQGEEYELQSFSIHEGKDQKGHYAAYLKTCDANGVIHYGRCDDQNPPLGYEEISQAHFLAAGQQASLLFYQKAPASS